jgi:hypothetical protein
MQTWPILGHYTGIKFGEVHNLLLSRLLFKKKHLKNKIYRTKFTFCFIWVSNLVYYIKGRTQIAGFENRVLRKFEPEKDEVTGGW